MIAVEHGKLHSFPVAPIPKYLHILSNSKENQLIIFLREAIVDTNGAGDAFVGGFLAQQVQLDFKMCISFSCALSGSWYESDIFFCISRFLARTSRQWCDAATGRLLTVSRWFSGLVMVSKCIISQRSGCTMPDTCDFQAWAPRSPVWPSRSLFWELFVRWKASASVSWKTRVSFRGADQYKIYEHRSGLWFTPEVNISRKISISAQPLKMALHRNPAMHGSRMIIFLHDSKKALF